MTKHNDNNHGSPLAVYQVWEEMWTAIMEKQQGTDLRLSDDLLEFIEKTKQLVRLAEEEKLDPSPLVLFLAGTERFYSGVGTSIPKLTDPVRTLLRRLERRLEQTAPPTTPSPAVTLAGKTKQPIVRGKPKPVLRLAQFNVVKALVDAGDTGLTVDQLVQQSGHADARGILKRLADSDPDWRAVIHFPGKSGGHYRIG
jgi:hypothetical protein